MAERTEIAEELNALAIHCPPRLMEVEARALWMRDWCEDLADYPISAIRSACRKWRLGGATKFPTGGQLLPLVKAATPSAPTSPDAQPKPWTPLADDEYAKLSVREKIRHLKILAHEAGCKAGPMWKNPPGRATMKRPAAGHVALEDMPASYRHWRGIQEGHLAEAKRLQEFINSPQDEASARQRGEA